MTKKRQLMVNTLTAYTIFAIYALFVVVVVFLFFFEEKFTNIYDAKRTHTRFFHSSTLI